MPSTKSPVRAASALQTEVTHAVTAVRAAFMELLAGLPPVRRPVELSRLLGIDYTMSRKALRIAEAVDPISVASEIPRPAALPRILKGSADKGVDESVLHRVEKAVENYESLAKRYAGDRVTFDAMVALLSPESAERAHFESKRAAYRANTQLLGRQADVVIYFAAMRPSRHQEDYREVIWICGQFGLKRFYPSVSLEVFTTLTDVPTFPLEHDGPFQSGNFLIKEFCSDPLPDLKPLPAIPSEGLTRFELDSEEVGLQSAVDCVVGQVCHLPRTEPNQAGQRLAGLQTSVMIPTAVCFMDLFVHETLVPTAPPVCFTLSNTVPSYQPISTDPPDHSLLLSVQPSAQLMGRGPRAACTKEVPRYDQLIRYTFEKANWLDADEYQLIRCRVDYPILNTHTILRIPV